MMNMNALHLPLGQITQRGAQIYDRLRPMLEPEHNGKYVVIDVETGAYELDIDHLVASNRAAARNPGAALYAQRVGMRVVGHIGGRLAAVRP